MNVSNVFTLLQSALSVVTANPLLSILLGLAVAGLIFGLLSRLFVRR